MESVRRRSPSEVLRRGYSDDELVHIYELARLFLELGDLHRAELIVTGLIEVSPDFAPARLAKGYIALHSGEFDQAIEQGRLVLSFEPTSAQAMLLIVTACLSNTDYNQAGTLLGEVGDAIESGQLNDPNLIRYYRLQLARYQTRGT